MQGKVVGKYVIETRLGGGGMGTVYRARHVTLGRVAAVKILLPELCANADFIQRFFNEARAATSIHHLGIVEVYDYGRMSDGVAYIAMELLHGDTLAKRMKQGIDTIAALRFVRLICGALGAAHDRGIVHRDLKPDNVFIIRDPEVVGGERIKLLDFGIAKLTLDPAWTASHRTRTGTLIGTPAYMAPEQCRGVPVDWRADIYALGCIMYELFAGRPPFRGEGVGDVLGAHMYAQPVPITTAAPGICKLIDRMLAKQPADRPQTTGAITDEIDALLVSDLTPVPGPAVAGTTIAPGLPAEVGSLTAPAPPASTESTTATTLFSSVATVPARPTLRRKRRLALAAVLGSIGLAAIATVAGTLGGRDAAPPSGARGEPIALSPASRGHDPAVPPDAAPDAPHAAVVASGDPAGPIRVKLDSTPPGSQVVLDGRSLGATPLNAILPRTGRGLVFTIRHAGYQDAHIEATGDSDVERAVTLETRRTAPAAVSGPRGGSSHRRHIGSDEEVNPFQP